MGKSNETRACQLTRLKVFTLFSAALVTSLSIFVYFNYYSSLLDDTKLSKLRSRRVSVSTKRHEEMSARLNWLLNAVQEKTDKLKILTYEKEHMLRSTESALSGAASPLKAPKAVDMMKSPANQRFEGHRILSLSDVVHESTPLSEMMSWYGEADGGGSCSEDFGNKLIDKWRGTRQSNCASTERRGEDINEVSSVDCFLIHQTRHHGDGDNLCLMKNVAVNIGLFGDDSITRPVVKQYVDTRHNVQPYIHFPRGFVKAACAVRTELWKETYMPGWNADWTTSALQTVSSVKNLENKSKRVLDPKGVICDEWVDHPVLVVQRDTFANFFHDSEDFFNAFIAMAVLEWRKDNTQVYLTDLYPKGPFWDIWSDVFSPKGSGSGSGSGTSSPGSVTAWDLRNSYGQRKSKHNNKNEYHVCYKQLAVGIYGPAAPVTVASWDTPCSRTALVRAYSDHVIRGLGMQGDTHYAASEPSQVIVITFMARRPSSEWPEKKFCSDVDSFFLCKLWESFGSRSLGRMVENEAQVVAALKALEHTQHPNGATVKFQDVDYNILTFKEQIKIDLETDIMIGPHGAGLMHNIFMRDRATLIELFIDGSSQNRHFHNLAHWYGRTYEGVTISNPITVPHLVSLVSSHIARIDLSRY